MKFLLFDFNILGNLENAVFLERINRFVGRIKINNEIKLVHIADTGRLNNLLMPGTKIKVLKNDPNKKTDFTLIYVFKEGYKILVNTKIHSIIGYNFINKGFLGFKPREIKREVIFENSRLDYLVDNKLFVELKGCNLCKKNICYFPDAPTKRGVKHLNDLIKAKEKGYDTMILIMSMWRNSVYFLPNKQIDPLFYNNFYHALKCGVQFRGFKIEINEDDKIVYAGNLKLL